MTDYNAIQLSIERAIASLQADMEFLKEVKASQNLVDTYQAEITHLDTASEIVWAYRDLEK